MVMNPAALRPEKDFAGESQLQLYITDPPSRQRGRPITTNPQLSKYNICRDERQIGCGSQMVV
jgi:hypothetical protein